MSLVFTVFSLFMTSQLFSINDVTICAQLVSIAILIANHHIEFGTGRSQFQVTEWLIYFHDYKRVLP